MLTVLFFCHGKRFCLMGKAEEIFDFINVYRGIPVKKFIEVNHESC